MARLSYVRFCVWLSVLIIDLGVCNKKGSTAFLIPRVGSERLQEPGLLLAARGCMPMCFRLSLVRMGGFGCEPLAFVEGQDNGFGMPTGSLQNDKPTWRRRRTAWSWFGFRVPFEFLKASLQLGSVFKTFFVFCFVKAQALKSLSERGRGRNACSPDRLWGGPGRP